MSTRDFHEPLREEPPSQGNVHSDAAARSMRPHVQQQGERILAFLRQRGERGATSDEVEMALGISHQSASARLGYLHKKAGIVSYGPDRRATGSGRAAGVYRIKGFRVQPAPAPAPAAARPSAPASLFDSKGPYADPG